MKILKLILALTLFFSLAACSDDDNGNNPSDITKQIFPLKAGNYWVYNRSFPSSEIVLDYTYTAIVSENVKLNGKCCYYLKFDNLTFPKLYSVKDDGMYVVDPYSTNNDIMLYKYPCSKGDTFQDKRYAATVIVESVAEDITVPAGIFSCIKYTMTGKSNIYGEPCNFRISNWVCQGTGLIKSESYDYNITTQAYYLASIDELTSYSI